MVERERILYLTFDFLEPIFSGNGTLSRIQVFGLLELGYKFLIFCPDEGDLTPKMEDWVRNGSLRIIPISIQSSKDLSPACDWEGFHISGLQKVNIVSEFNPQLIINPDWHTADLAYQIKQKYSIPLIGQFFRIFSYFNDYIPNKKEYQLVKGKEQKLVEYSDIVITLSSFDRQWCLNLGAKRVHIVHPPLMDSFIQALSESAPKKTQDDIVRLITVSRIVPEKKILRIFPILQELNKLGVNFFYTLIGESLDEDYMGFIENAIQNSNIQSKVQVIGRINLPELVSNLKNHPIYIHTGEYEPFGITIIEAAAAGCTIILDKDGLIGAKELLETNSKDIPLIKIDYLNPAKSALVIRNLLDTGKIMTTNTSLEKFVSNLIPKQYMENLVKIFRTLL